MLNQTDLVTACEHDRVRGILKHAYELFPSLPLESHTDYLMQYLRAVDLTRASGNCKSFAAGKLKRLFDLEVIQ